MGNRGDYEVRLITSWILYIWKHVGHDCCDSFIRPRSSLLFRHSHNRVNYQSSNQEAQEGTVCNFIKNLITHSYDEYGEIYLESDGWASYIPDVNTMPRWQKYALSVSALMTVGLWAYAWYLRREITQRKFVWYPRGRRGYSTNGAGGLTDHTGLNDRTNSGIIQGRSQGSFDFETRHGGTLIWWRDPVCGPVFLSSTTTRLSESNNMKTTTYHDSLVDGCRCDHRRCYK